jgi:hypothetical protein
LTVQPIKFQSRKGVAVEIDGRVFQCPPLTLAAHRELTRAGVFEAINAAVKAGSNASAEQQAEMLGAWVSIVSAALSAVDPSCTEEFVGSLPLTVNDLASLVGAILKASGMVSDASEGDHSPQTLSP